MNIGTSIKNTKNDRREAAIKKAKSKKLLALIICAIVAIILIVAVIIQLSRESKSEIYTDGQQTIKLFSDGKFTAELAHENRNGTFSKQVDNSSVIVTFTYDGVSVQGAIENNALTIPEEWRDSHGHGEILPKK